MPEYFSAKFPERAATIRLLSTFIIAFFFVFYVGAQFAGAGKTIQTTFGVDPLWGQVIIALLVMAYASFGGFMSVVAVDAFQAILMILTLVVTPLVMLGQVLSGPVSLAQALQANPGMGSLTGGATGFAAGLLIFNNFSWFFGYLGGQPQLNARFMGMPDDRQVAIGRNIAVAWTVLAYGGAITIGLCALALFGRGAIADPEMVLPHALTSLFPTWLAGILLAGAVAAMVSTAESMLIVAGTAVSQDAYKGIIKQGRVADRTVLAVSRGATLTIGLFALVLALTTDDLVYSIVSYAWAGIGCSFAPAVLLSFYWDRFNSIGVATALLVGLVTTVVWIVTGLEAVVTSMAVTFFTSMGAAVLVALATSGKEPATVPAGVRTTAGTGGPRTAE
jgi:sodium/proline symporter